MLHSQQSKNKPSENLVLIRIAVALEKLSDVAQPCIVMHILQ